MRRGNRAGFERIGWLRLKVFADGSLRSFSARLLDRVQTDLILVVEWVACALPGCFTGGKHAANCGYNQEDHCQSSNDIPPGVIAYLGNPGKPQCIDHANKTANRANHNTEPEHRNRRNQLLEQKSAMA